MSVGELTDEMLGAGVIGAGRVGKAVDIIAEMFSNPEYTTFLTIAGPLVPSGLREIFSDLIKLGLIDGIITNGANIIHDLIEAMDKKHYIGSKDVDDEELHDKGINRVYDIFVKSEVFLELEEYIGKLLDDIPNKKRASIPIHSLLTEIGLRLDDPGSIIYNAPRNDVPIFCPGLLDSMLGIPLWMYSKNKELNINTIKDFELLADMVYEAKRSGAIILGGGMPKHHAQYLHTLRGGLDAAIQISSAIPADGSLSGAPLKEAVSWGKLKGKHMDMTSSVWGDVTIIFPLIVAAALEKI
jgi:deoxyhypusine synthase